MKMLAVVTEDFAFYHDVVGMLKKRGVSFISLGVKDPVPGMVGAVVTTEQEAPNVRFENVFPVGYEALAPQPAPKGASPEPCGPPGRIDPTAGAPNHHDPDGKAGSARALEMAVDRALAFIMGKGSIELLVVGIDPGKRPGLAVLGDASLLKKIQVESPEEVGGKVRQIVETYRPKDAVVKLGDGAPTQRDRIVNDINVALADTGHKVRLELVDEKNSSDVPHHSDTEAALKIALTVGTAVWGPRDVNPTEGEIREIQRRSRMLSDGKVTISRELAQQVALGVLELAEAIELHGRRD